MKFFKISFSSLILSCFLLLPQLSQAQSVNDPLVMYDWYIKDFQTEIQVNKDSSLTVTEKILADCPECVYKHGIFRTLPLETNIPGKTIDRPIQLISITDFDGDPYNFESIKNYTDNTITWKIGDANIEVTGENGYLIKYKVDNAILFDNPDFDEFYWNLNGAFWQLEIANFHAKVIFPPEVNKNNTEIDYYAGEYGEKDKSLAEYQWTSDNILEFQSTRSLDYYEGISASVVFPKKIFTPYKPPFIKTYGGFFWLLLPIIMFILLYRYWNKKGKDPKVDKAIIPFYEPPAKLTPMEMGVVMSNGGFNTNYISAAIVNLAVKGLITIEQTKEKAWLSSEDYKLYDTSDSKNIAKAGKSEKLLLEKLFGGKKEIKLSDLKNKFYVHVSSIKNSVIDRVKSQTLITDSGKVAMFLLIFLAAGMTILGFITMPIFPKFGVSFFLSGLITLYFGIFMGKRTQKGAELSWEIKGFKLFMETAEKYRARFYEKEHIFEELLPYAIIFGITKLWVQKMKDIYGEEFFDNYHPAWFTGAGLANFNVDSLTSAVNSVSANISSVSSSVSSSSGSSSGFSGGGFSGGGGGGGGGGGW